VHSSKPGSTYVLNQTTRTINRGSLPCYTLRSSQSQQNPSLNPLLDYIPLILTSNLHLLAHLQLNMNFTHHPFQEILFIFVACLALILFLVHFHFFPIVLLPVFFCIGVLISLEKHTSAEYIYTLLTDLQNPYSQSWLLIPLVLYPSSRPYPSLHVDTSTPRSYHGLSRSSRQRHCACRPCSPFRGTATMS
jgi:hypothetical protein